MRKWKSGLCMLLVFIMLVGDLSLLNVRADEGLIVDEIQAGEGVSVSDNSYDVSGGDMEVWDEEPTVSGNDADISSNDGSFSVNDIFEEETIEEAVEDIAWEEVQQAIAELTSRKFVMALVYLTDSYAIRKEPHGFSETIINVNSGQTVLIQDVAVDEDGTVWYRAEFEINGVLYEGYLEKAYLAYSDEEFMEWEENYLLPYLQQQYGDNAISQFTIAESLELNTPASVSSGYADIDQFPKSYWNGLSSLKKKYPKWTFVKLDVTNLDFEEVIAAQYGEKSYIWKTAPEDYREGQTGQENWYYASKKAISYYMDPRKHLTENEVFQFELLSYNGSYHTEAALQGILSSTFMSGKIPGEGITYAKAFMQIGNNYSISPYHLASRVILEQGTAGGSPLISGTYPGYEGYYNYFNVGATGKTDKEVIVNGLAYAESKKWNTRYKSLLGGASTIGNNYIKIGQNTLYLQKFQVIVTGRHPLYTHQYQQNIQAPTTEGTKNYKTYSSSGTLNNSFVFRIPVYSHMPSTVKRVELNETEHNLLITQAEVDGRIIEQPESFNLKATVIDTDESIVEFPVTWKSENSKIATVDKNGTVTAVKVGTTNIVASAGGRSVKCKITVKAPLYCVEIEPSSGEIYVGESRKLSVSYIPLYTTDSVESMTWSSSDESIATVYKGLVQGKGSGTAIITAKVIGEDGTEHKAEYALTVKSCKVQFFNIEGELWSSMELSYGDVLEGKFPNIDEWNRSESHVFSGWYSKPDGQGIRCTDSTVVYGDLNLYPYFITTDQDFFVKNVGDYTFTGQAITPEVEVYDGETLLVKGVDYTVSYSNNKNAASVDSTKKPTITVKGKGNYSGTQKIYFNILQKDINEADIKADDLFYAYTGKVIKPNPVISRDGKKLVKGKDYTVTYPAENVGAYLSEGIFPVEIHGTKNYSGSRKIYLTITKNTLLSKVSVSKIGNQEYDDGKPIEPVITIKHANQILKEDEHYTVSYQNNTEIGTATAVITAVDGSGFSGTRVVTYKITGVPMNKVKVSGLTSLEYCGSPITIFDENGISSGVFPEFTITYTDSKTKEVHGLELGKDYTIEYNKNEAKGKATVIFRGKGKYTGTLKKSFTINAYDISKNESGYVYLKSTDLGQQEYSRAGAKPKLELYFTNAEGEEKLLQEGVDYTLSYQNNKSVNDGTNLEKVPTITIKGKGSLKGTWKNAATFTIGAKSIEEGADNGITVTAKDLVYKEGKEDYPPNIVVKDNGKTLKVGKDYEIVSWTKVSQGETGVVDYTAQIQALKKADGTAEYTGTRTVNYRVYLYTLSKASIQKIPNQVYEEKTANSDAGICPVITVTYKVKNAKEAELFNQLGYELYDTKNQVVIGEADGRNIILKKGDTVLLREDRDYILTADSYKNNRKKGTAKVTIYGMDLFAGSKSINYKIVSKPLKQRLMEFFRE